MSSKILCHLRDISFPQLFVSRSAKYPTQIQLKVLKAMEILSGEQMRGPRKI